MIKIFKESIKLIKKIKYIIFVMTLFTLASLAFGFYYSNVQIGWIVELKEVFLRQVEDFTILQTIADKIASGRIWQAIFTTFGFNLISGAIFSTVFTGIVVFFPFLIMMIRGFMIGLIYGDIDGNLSYYVLFYGTLILEFGAYVLSSSAGVNIGLSYLLPKRFGTKNRIEAFGKAWIEAAKVMVIVAIILFIAAVWEIGGLYFLIQK